MKTNYPTISPFGINDTIDGMGKLMLFLMLPLSSCICSFSLFTSLCFFSSPLTSMAKGSSPSGFSPYLQASSFSSCCFLLKIYDVYEKHSKDSLLRFFMSSASLPYLTIPDVVWIVVGKKLIHISVKDTQISPS
jgi:hypothetical protein